MRECTKCHQMKDETDYYTPRDYRRYRECKECMKDRAKKNFRKRRYGLTFDQYQEMVSLQGNLCAICQMTEAENGKLLAIDHDHQSGKVRQILCDDCNRMLGSARDNPQILVAAAEYLTRHGK
jgi:hypothetical protein